MTDLFDHAMQERMKSEAPLAARMRPRILEEYIGQEHIIGEGKLLRRAIEADRLFSSIILWGPPGTGKTTLAQVIANSTKSHFVTISAILAGKADLRVAIDDALERRRLNNEKTILFVDEVHRWNKAQQDALLPHVENGTFTLIGATTENPYFEVIKALISRSRVFQLRNLNQNETGILLDRALADKERGYGNKKITFDPDARSHLIEVASGDARNALNALELAVESTAPDGNGIVHITLDVAQESIQRRAVLYDKDGDAHYDTISAFIKSVRGSDPDAALYWLAKMIYAGEDPKFIIRRLIILAGEDIGIADPMGLVVASSAAQAFEFIGLPEGIYPIVEATLYLATAPKSNSAGAYFKAMKKIEDEGQVSVPRHLMDSNRDAAAMGHGKDYVYPHEMEGHFTPQQYLPKRLLGTYFYAPSQEGYEAQVTSRLEMWREAQRKALGITKVETIPAMSEEQIQEMKRKIK
ncbi:MAG: AAA family ATPase [Anaerolineales bacterium]|jgi:putative ATPase|uniref:AAA family ATPase n=1 Tax=Candidatus Villigracilis vicinus TaxID=3140679 RepID=UPI003136AB5F|nr:AAA family ATPase [Anaerolineales bacterium]MBK7451512.1 AAA family ATPase [Anaerolineales bacterium]MBK9782262.1 AAA family ATPase [Anaerolineales bacterium]